MTDDCVVHLWSGAEKQLAGLARRDPLRAAIIRKLLEQIEENGWILSAKAEIVKVLRESQCIGELRDVGKGGYRLFMFWHDTAEAREIWVCNVVPKRDVESRRRLNDICDAVAKLRNRFLEEVG